MPVGCRFESGAFSFCFYMEKHNFRKENTMQKRPLDTELEVLRAEHLEDDVFSVRAYNVLVRRLGLRTLGDILNLTCDDIAKAKGAGKKTIEEIAGLVQSCGYELNGFAKASPDSKQQKQISFLRRAHQHFFQIGKRIQPLVLSPPKSHLCIPQQAFRRGRLGHRKAGHICHL